MAKIVRLDDQLSNKIAAGEVVERPASVVKELVENAIDANSTVVEIYIDEGGLSKIKIVDNGDGIDKAECEIAFDRHATSKIQHERDLFRIETLGFRGEALPSIASVSHFELKTGTGEEAGTYLVLQGGKIIEKKSTSSRQGTEITVTNLFFNTPARLKHLKTVHTELGNITNTIYRLALANPEVSFSLNHNGKKTFYTNGNGDVRQVIAAIYGMNTAKKMIPLNTESLDFTVKGWLAKPEITRASRQHMFIFMNGRYIRNYPIAKAIQEGYHTLLPIGRFPVLVLHINMNPTLIDVNVHPSKLEARLSKEKELCHLIEQEIKDTFRQQQLIPDVEKKQTVSAPSEQQQFQFEHRHSEPKERHMINEPSAEPIHERKSTTEPPPMRPQQKNIESEITQENTESIPFETNNATKQNEHKSQVPPLYPIGQMHGTYILAQNENGLYVIDQHAAQERVKYEFYREKVGEVSSELQEMLVPLTFEFTASEAAVIDTHQEQLKEVGIFLESFGSQTYLVRSHPQWFPEGFERETVEDIMYQVTEQKRIDIKKLREEAAILMSCKRSIKANRHLHEEEIFSLLESLRKTIDPFTCPHGRPILIHFSTYEMEKMFKRVM